jgi:hypothetical protein
MFATIPSYNRYRTLRLLSERMRGEDVYALQKGINSVLGKTLAVDGVLGPRTGDAISDVQKALDVAVDGLAGGGTQRAIALHISYRAASRHGVPAEGMRGQLEHESGFRLGNYSPPRADGSYDAGVTQRNTRFHPPEVGFDPEPSIYKLAEVMRHHWTLFEGVRSNTRRWQLAQGAWNAPAYACFIAREEGARKVTAGMTARPGPTARATLEAYIDSVSAYLP